MGIFGRGRSTPPKRFKLTPETKYRHSGWQRGYYKHTDAIQQQQKHYLNENNVQIVGPGHNSSTLRVVSRIRSPFSTGPYLSFHSFTYTFTFFHLSIYYLSFYFFFQVSYPLKPAFQNHSYRTFTCFLGQSAFSRFPKLH